MSCAFVTLIQSAWSCAFETSSEPLTNPASRLSRDDLPGIPFEFSEDEDDSNGRLQKQNLFQYSPPSRPQRVFAIDNEWPLQVDFSKLNITKKFRNLIKSTVPSTYPNLPYNALMAKTLPLVPKRDEFAKISALLRPK